MKRYLIKVFPSVSLFGEGEWGDFIAKAYGLVDIVSVEWAVINDVPSLISFSFLSDTYIGLISPLLNDFSNELLFYVAFDIASGQRFSSPTLIYSENNFNP